MSFANMSAYRESSKNEIPNPGFFFESIGAWVSFRHVVGVDIKRYSTNVDIEIELSNKKIRRIEYNSLESAQQALKTFVEALRAWELYLARNTGFSWNNSRNV